MAAYTNDLFVLGDDFDAILNALEEEETIENEILKTVDNVSNIVQNKKLLHTYISAKT